MDNIDILGLRCALGLCKSINLCPDNLLLRIKITRLLRENSVEYEIFGDLLNCRNIEIPEQIKKSTVSYVKVEKILVYKNKTVDVYDLEVKDNHNFIVTGKMKTPYGLVAHNCHHYASPVFSRGIQKCGSPYILALSATPYRKDKLTDILFWNFGNIFYREKTKVNNQVICKIFSFTSDDKLFVEKKQWFNGKMKPSHTKMVNNFVEIEHRNIQLINILNELRKYPERKILVLSGRREHLTYLKETVDRHVEDDISKGILEPFEYKTFYYMGKMKENYRKEAEDNGDMFFGTYEMAHEGLDISRLNTIVLATPKKDIEQSVGRVMRKILKEGDLRPLIIDFRDEISIYAKQGDTRIKQYKRGKYCMEYYYLHNDRILDLRDHLRTKKKTENEIDEYIQKNPKENYVPEWSSILDLQVVEGENDDKPTEVYEVDPNVIDISDDENDDENGDDDDDDDECNKKNDKVYTKPNYSDYLF